MRTSAKAAIVGLAASALVLSGCSSRAVDVQQPWIEKVPGLGNMYMTCTEQDTLIKFTSLVGSWDDAAEYEAFWLHACYRDLETGRIVIGERPAPAPVGPVAPRSLSIPDGDLGNTQPGQEDE